MPEPFAITEPAPEMAPEIVPVATGAKLMSPSLAMLAVPEIVCPATLIAMGPAVEAIAFASVTVLLPAMARLPAAGLE